MSVLDYIDSEVFLPAYGNDVPMINNPRVDAICKEIFYAVQNQETIFVYGDYDADGMYSVMVWREVFSLMKAKPPVVFKYIQRTHNLDRDIQSQLKETDARVVIICDTGSGLEDIRLVNMLQVLGYTTVVIDHHVFEGDYFMECEHRLMFNSYEERQSMGDCDVSGAYASLLVAKVLCEKYVGCSLAYNAKVFALASMYSDCVDMSSNIARALYTSVCSASAPGPLLFTSLNKWGYLYGRRMFSYIVAPKINGCFRTGRFDVLNRVLSVENKFEMQTIAGELQGVHTDASARIKMFIPLFNREQFGEILLCSIELTDELAALNLSSFTGVIATQIANQEKTMTIVVVKDGTIYRGSYRDCYDREMLKTFQLFSDAAGHPAAFGLSFMSLQDFKRHLSLLSGQLDTEYEKPYTTFNSGFIESSADLDALALYNEFMNIRPRILVSHRCESPRLQRSTQYNKYYDVGLPGRKPVMTSRSLISGSSLLIEPAICRGVELREIV